MTCREWVLSIPATSFNICLEDADVLEHYASQVPEGGLIVEIGAYKGHSTGVLLIASRPRKARVVTIDPFWHKDGGYFARDFWANIETLPREDVERLIPIAAKSGDFRFTFYHDLEVDLLFVDGDHHAGAVADDLDEWGIQSEVVLLHDFYDYPNPGLVERAVGEENVAEGFRKSFCRTRQITRPNEVSSIACLSRA